MTFELALIGFGNVARRFVRLLDELKPELAREHGIAVRIAGVATRSRGRIADPKGLDAARLATHVEHGGMLGRKRGSTLSFIREITRAHAAAARRGRLVIAEATTLDVLRGQPATDHVRAALAGGAHVITSNKGPTAFAYHALSSAARRRGRCFLFESAALDGVPVFNLKRATMPAVTINGFQGVVNSTTNYILTAIEQGESFGGALEAMQRAGIAEADPSLDVDGWDAAAKTAALANVLLDARLTPHAVDREGLSEEVGLRVLAARAVGRRLKLIASAERTGGVVRGRVKLTEIPETDLLAGLEGQQNALVLQTDLLGDVAIVQRGWGLTQTAYGLVADLVAIAKTPATRPVPPPKPPDRSPSRRGSRRG